MISGSAGANWATPTSSPGRDAGHRRLHIVATVLAAAERRTPEDSRRGGSPVRRLLLRPLTSRQNYPVRRSPCSTASTANRRQRPNTRSWRCTTSSTGDLGSGDRRKPGDIHLAALRAGRPRIAADDAQLCPGLDSVGQWTGLPWQRLADLVEAVAAGEIHLLSAPCRTTAPTSPPRMAGDSSTR